MPPSYEVLQNLKSAEADEAFPIRMTWKIQGVPMYSLKILIQWVLGFFPCSADLQTLKHFPFDPPISA